MKNDDEVMGVPGEPESSSTFEGDFDGTEIAIVGMACRFPGATDVERFWENLRSGVESLTELSDEDLIRSGVPKELREHPSYVRRASILDDIRRFDAEFFGYAPVEARLMDPQHRLFLECAWEAFENAGYDPSAAAREGGAPVGVFTGAKTNTYLLGLFSNRELFDTFDPFHLALGNDLASMATRVSYKLDLRGPSYALHTACSTSLVAIHLACQSLILGECGMALAGGAAINVPQEKGYLYQQGGILSPDGSCRTFDADAAGSNFGNGVGALVLKRAEDAVRDGDHVYALIRGSATNNDGAKKASYTAPGVEGQTAVLIEALACSGVDAETISYVEAHGTATDLGDSIELLALTQAFRASTDAEGFCALGSVKTNLGHLETAAGVAGIIKTALALEREELPPSLHFESPNPKITLEGSPFYVNAEPRPWPRGPRGASPRRAGVSSFGIGSTNAHAILEEAPALPATSTGRPWQLLTLSARTETALDRMTDRLADHLERTGPDAAGLADTAYTLQVGRRAFAERRAVVCGGSEGADGAVRTLRERRPERRIRTGTTGRGAAGPERPVAFLLPGLGDHYLEMGLGLYQAEPAFRRELDRCAEILRPDLGEDLRRILYPRGTDAAEAVAPGGGGEPDLRRLLGRGDDGLDPELAEAARRLDRTEIAHPALFAVEWSLARLWMRWGVRPAALVGYSLGELTAAALAGVFSLEDALGLVVRRARLIGDQPAGAMLAVPFSEDDLASRLEVHGLSLAAVNGPMMTVAAGPEAGIDALAAELAGEEVVCRRLRTGHAFHSAELEPVAEELTALVREVDRSAPEIPYLSNVTGTWITPEEAADPGYWARHMSRPVRFGDAVGELLRGDERFLLEVGPGASLSSFARLHPDCDGPRSRWVFSSMPAARGEGAELERALHALGGLWCQGAVPDWSAVHEGERRRRTPLPSYPFEGEEHWIEPYFPSMPAVEGESAAASAPGQQGEEKIAEIRDWFHLPVWEDEGPVAGGDAAAGEGTLEEDEPWLLLGGPEGLTEALARELTGRGAVVHRADATLSADDLRRRLAEIEEGGDSRGGRGGRRVRRFVHLGAAEAPPDLPDPLSESERFRHEQRRGYDSLVALGQVLGAPGSPGSPGRGSAFLDVVSTRVQPVTGDEELAPERSVLLGPCRVIPQEVPTVGCRHLDLPAAVERADGAAAEAAAKDLLAELLREPDGVAVAHRDGRRRVQRFAAHPLPAPEDTPAADRVPVFRDGGVYWITGGLGGIGLALGRHLAEAHGARLVLTRRSEMPSREAWEEWLAEPDEDDPTSRTLRAVLDLESRGAEVLVASADVADEDAMARVVAEAVSRFGDLHGVIHAAGVLDPDSFETLSQGGGDAERHFLPKVHGLYVLEKVLAGRNLDFRLLFSSLSAFLGGLGYVGYAAANGFMDFFAHSRNRRADRSDGDGGWVSVDWDSWHYPEEGEESGGLGTTLVDLAMTPEEGVDALARILADVRESGRAQLVVSTGDLASRLERWVPVRGLPRPVSAAGSAALPRGQALERRVAAIWARVLGRDEVGTDDNFFELGGNSLLGMQLIGEMSRELGVEISPVSLFESPTVSGIARQLAPPEPVDLPAALISDDEPAAALPSAGGAAGRSADDRGTSEDVAIVAMVGRFPGAKSVDELWDNLLAGRETISFFSDEELLSSGVSREELDDPRYVKARPILEDVDLFDAPLFGYSPRDAEIMDPQHRLFLEAAWELMEEAGYDPERIAGPVGVYAGASISSYMYNLFGNPDLAESVGTFPILIGNEKDSVTTKVSYKLGLRGPSLAVQTFCSTSLVAVHLAARGLINRECDMALAGGVSIILPQKTGYAYQPGGIGSRDGHIRAFDEGASGIVFGNGLGLVALKRLDDALADGDRIHAVIKGSGVNNDGAVKAGYTATSVDGQADLVTAVLERTGIDPASLGFMEAHGSGTPLGDPIEVAALTRAFRRHGDGQADATGVCPLGSVKTNVGHLDRTAGVIGLIKAALAVEHGVIPPTLHFETPNPSIDFAGSPFFVNTEVIDFPERGDGPRRAGVNSLGLGGTNAHAILEQAPEIPPSDPAAPWQLLLLSARSQAALDAATERLAHYLEERLEERPDEVNLADVAFTLQVGRKGMSHRRAVVCRDAADARAVLREHATGGGGRIHGSVREEGGAEVTFLFPGLGGQYPGMAKGLYESAPVFRRAIDRCAERLEPRLGVDFRTLLYPERPEGPDGESEEEPGPGDGGIDLRKMLGRNGAGGTADETRDGRLDETRIAHPVLFSIQLALARLWASWGVQPAALVGYSVGEYVAACLAGVLTVEEGLELVAERARLIEELHPSGGGAMTAVPLAEGDLDEWLGDDLSLAAANGPEQSVLAGPVAAVEALERRLDEAGIAYRRLQAGHAFHSHVLEPIRERLAELASGFDLRPPRVPTVSNVTGAWLRPEDAVDPHYWARHSVSPVRFADAARELLAEPGRIFLELGPGQVLGSLLLQHGQPGGAGGQRPTVLGSVRHSYERRADRAHLLETLGKLWLAGGTVDWRAVHGDDRRLRVRLPTYPFERRRYWVESPAGGPAEAIRRRAASASGGAAGDALYVPSWRRGLPARSGRSVAIGEAGAHDSLPASWLVLSDTCGVGGALAERLRAAGRRVVEVAPEGAEGCGDWTEDRAAAVLRELDGPPEGVVDLRSLDAPANESPEAAWERASGGALGALRSLAGPAADGSDGSGARPRALWIVSGAAWDVTGDESLRPGGALSLAPLRVLPREIPGLTVRAVDVIPPRNGSAAHLAERLLAEMARVPAGRIDPGAAERLVAFRGRHRWVPEMEPFHWGEAAGSREGGVFLVTGGLDRRGFAFAEHLARNVPGVKLALVDLAAGASGAPDGLGDAESHRERRAAALEAAGAQVFRHTVELEGEALLAGGVEPADALRDALAAVRERFSSEAGGLQGVIHAAEPRGVRAAYGLALENGEGGEAGRRLLAERIGFARALSQVLAEQDAAPAFALLVASTASIQGGLGRLYDAAADLYLATWVGSRSTDAEAGGEPTVPWTTVHWGFWTDEEDRARAVGPRRGDRRDGEDEDVVARRQERVLAALFRALPATEPGLRAMAPPQLVAPAHPFDGSWNRIGSSSEASSEGDRAAASETAPGGRYERPALSAEYEPPETETERRIAAVWEAMLGVSGIGVHDPFLELGGDSLLAARLVARMREELDVDVPVPLFFEAPTVRELARAVEEMRAASAREEEDDVDELLGYLDSLSEEDVEAELARRLADGAGDGASGGSAGSTGSNA